MRWKPESLIGKETDRFQRWLIETEIVAQNGNIVHAAKALGMNRTAFYQTAKRLGVQIDYARKKKRRAVVNSALLAKFLGVTNVPRL